MSIIGHDPAESQQKPFDPQDGHRAMERQEAGKVTVNSTPMDSFKSTFTRYLIQLLHGCGNSACREIMCLTGRRNTSSRPVRAYNRRSARAIALALTGGASPMKHLCLHYVPPDSDIVKRLLDTDEDALPRDNSSTIQSMHDTSTIRQLSSPDSTAANDSSVSSRERFFSDVHDSIQSWYKLRQANPEAPIEITPLCQIAHRLIPYSLLDQDFRELDFLVTNMSVGSWAPVVADNDCDSARLLSRHRILDAMSHGPACQLLDKVVCGLELQDPGSPKMQETGKPPAIAQAFSQVFVREASKVSPTGLPGVIFFFMWLRSRFLAHWRECPHLLGLEASYAFLLVSFASVLQSEPSAADLAFVTSGQHMSAIGESLDAANLAATWLTSLAAGSNACHVFHSRGLFSERQRYVYFRTINHLRMRDAHSQSVKNVETRARLSPPITVLDPDGQLGWQEEHYLLIGVNRNNVLRSAFDQLWQRRRAELFRPLRVRLGEVDAYEIGHDLGGVQNEFFNLVCKEIFREETQMFTTNRETGYSYFRPGSLQPLYMFQLVGMLFSLAIYNGIRLPVNMPHAFYSWLLAQRIEKLSQIVDYWPAEARSLCAIVQGLVPDLDATFPLEANGLRLEIMDFRARPGRGSGFELDVLSATPIETHAEGQWTQVSSQTREIDDRVAQRTAAIVGAIADTWPGIHLVLATKQPCEITAENRMAYAKRYLDWLTAIPMSAQWKAFSEGFYTCLDQYTLKTLFTPAELARIVQGSPVLEVDELRRVTRYEGYNPDSPYMQAFWHVVECWKPKKQMQLIKFVTATERLPAAGAGELTFKISRSNAPDPNSLPTASTCFGILMLPAYANAEILEQKLSLAIECGLEGFGSG